MAKQLVKPIGCTGCTDANTNIPGMLDDVNSEVSDFMTASDGVQHKEHIGAVSGRFQGCTEG
jgi:hypothetical protein